MTEPKELVELVAYAVFIEERSAHVGGYGSSPGHRHASEAERILASHNGARLVSALRDHWRREATEECAKLCESGPIDMQAVDCADAIRAMGAK